MQDLDTIMAVRQAPSTQPACVVFAGGGTGGHIYPGLAIAERIRELLPSTHLSYLCSTKTIDATILEEADFTYESLPAVGLSMRPALIGPLRFIRGWIAARARAKRVLRPLAAHYGAQRMRLVLLGGYVAAPAASAAASLGIHVTLLNLDVVPGKANRIAARWANEIVSAVDISGRSPFPGSVPVLGMPIRRQAIRSDDPATCRARLGLDARLKTLFVTGASQGAGTLNDLVVRLVRDETSRTVFEGWQVLHLCGPERALEESFETAGVPARVIPFLHAMGDAWGAADLALARAGASTVGEAVLNQVPTVFAPYPWHRDQHQMRNAEPVVRARGGWLAEDRIEVDANCISIGQVLLAAMRDPDVIPRARAALVEMANPDAALEIAKRVLGFDGEHAREEAGA